MQLKMIELKVAYCMLLLKIVGDHLHASSTTQLGPEWENYLKLLPDTMVIPGSIGLCGDLEKENKEFSEII